MPTAIPSRATEGRWGRLRRPLAILVGWNLPWLLWTAAAALRASGGIGLPIPCPADRLLGVCPGCGLTGDYAAALRGETLRPWLLLVLAGFLFCFLDSVRRAWRAWRPHDRS